MSTDRLNKGDIVLVTGATGLIGSSVTNALIARGLKVRGITRDVTKTAMLKDKLDKLYGAGQVEFIGIPDATLLGAYRAALEGVSGLIHLAVDMDSSFGPNPDVNKAIDASVDMTVGILQSAADVPTIKAAVVTSSCTAHYLPEPTQDFVISVEQWNDAAVKMALELPSDHAFRGPVGYMAAKTKAEQAVWAWVEETKPSFAVNTVLPHMVLGAPFNPAPGSYSSSTALSSIFDGKVENNSIVGFASTPYWTVHVDDTALIHVAALLAPDVNHQKLWAAGAEPTSLNTILGYWRKAYPKRTIVPDFEAFALGKQELDRSKETELLKRYAGRDWFSLEQAVLDNVKAQAQA